jgi:hypothetical protein
MCIHGDGWQVETKRSVKKKWEEKRISPPILNYKSAKPLFLLLGSRLLGRRLATRLFRGLLRS